MIGLLCLLVMATATDSLTEEQNQDHPDSLQHQPPSNAEPTPDFELLMFLAEWGEFEGDEWLDPEVFAQDSTFNQQLDNQQKNTYEKDPDNH